MSVIHLLQSSFYRAISSNCSTTYGSVLSPTIPEYTRKRSIRNSPIICALLEDIYIKRRGMCSYCETRVSLLIPGQTLITYRPNLFSMLTSPTCYVMCVYMCMLCIIVLFFCFYRCVSPNTGFAEATPTYSHNRTHSPNRENRAFG